LLDNGFFQYRSWNGVPSLSLGRGKRNGSPEREASVLFHEVRKRRKEVEDAEIVHGR
jgi:hypothetical protein